MWWGLELMKYFLFVSDSRVEDFSFLNNNKSRAWYLVAMLCYALFARFGCTIHLHRKMKIDEY